MILLRNIQQRELKSVLFCVMINAILSYFDIKLSHFWIGARENVTKLVPFNFVNNALIKPTAPRWNNDGIEIF